MPTPQKKRSEDGYTLIAVIFLLFLLAISLTVAAPRVAREIQMDRERETVHRGLQYRRAIQLYYRKFQAYPPSLEALTKTNNIRFLRQKYVDPITGKADWKAIAAGQAKVPTLGFFGEPLAGSASTVAGTGPSGGNSATGTTGSPTDTSSSAFGSPSSTTSPTSSSTSSSSDGKTFGGAGIVGFEPASTRQSILIYKKKNHYNEWEFTYDPLSDQKKISNNSGSIGTSAASTSTPIGSSSSTSSSSSSTSSQ